MGYGKLFSGLVAANVGAWLGAALAFRHFPVLLGTALVAYSLGLRHAVDADHIAAIDNVTRKLMQQGERPRSVGLWFSLGHSTVVMLGAATIAGTALALQGRWSGLRAIGGVMGTSVSALFLLGIALVNLVALLSAVRALRRQVGVAARGLLYAEDDRNLLLGSGMLARLLRPLFGMVRQSWHMYPVGVLFGLGFDTASEIGLLGISAAEAAKGLGLGAILVFPALFAAGMALVDSADNWLMLGAYGWAMAQPMRRLYYNVTVTAISALVALAVGGVEALGILRMQLGGIGRGWAAVEAINAHLGAVGLGIVATLALVWAAAAAVRPSAP